MTTTRHGKRPQPGTLRKGGEIAAPHGADFEVLREVPNQKELI